MMPILPDTVSGSRVIEPGQVTVMAAGLDPRYTDDAAVQLVIQDAQRARTFLDQKQWNLFWRESDVLMQSPRTNQVFEGSTVSRANISRFTVAKHVNSLVPSMKSGIFYETPPFLIRPRPATSQTTARAKTALFGTLLDSADFETVAEDALESMTCFGTVIVKAVWKKETRKKKIKVPQGEPIKQKLPLGGELTIHTKESNTLETKDVDVTEQGIELEVCELGSVLVDPTWRKPNALHKHGKYVVHVTYPTWRDLEDLRQQKEVDEDGTVTGGYDIPSEEQLKAYFFEQQDGSAAGPSQVVLNLGGQNWSIHHAQNPEEPASVAPDERPIQMLERTDRTYVYTVLCPDGGDRGVLIRKEEHGFPFLNFFASNFWNIPNSGYGIGVGRLAGSDQRIEKGLTDALLDLLSYATNPMYARDRGANAPTQQIRTRLGGIVDVDVRAGQSVRDVFGIIESPKVPPEVFPTLQAAAQSAQSTTGADEAFTQGNLPGRGGSSAARTATGAGGIMSANASKIQGPVGHFVKGVLLPVIELLDFFVKDRMEPQEIRQILDEELGAAFDLDAKNFYESRDRFECLAGAHLAAKRAMAQALPLMVQIFENAPLIQQLNQTGYVIDVRQLLEMFMEVSEWKNARELIRPMNPQEQAKYQQASTGGQQQQKTQAQIAAIGARHQAKSEEIDQTNEAKLAQDLLGKAGDQAAAWDERKWARAETDQSLWAP
jgi:hypothetical protein